MAQSAPNQQPDEFYRANARAYLRSLISGVKPDIRPEFGKYERALRMVESAFAEIKPGEHAKMLPRSIKTIGNIRANKDLKFHALLTEQGEEQASEGQQTGPLLGMPTLPQYAIIPPAVSLHACPELDWYEAYSKQASDRAFPGYHAFCGLWLFSALAGRRVSLKLNAKEFNTNLMLGLVAETSFSAKSFTANIAKQVMYKLGLDYRLGPDRMTSQKLLSDMSGKWIPTDYDDLPQERQDEILHTLAVPGQKGLLFDEMGKFIQGTARKNSSSVEFVDLLLSLNDCPPNYKNATIIRGSEPIDKPYISLLGCMTPSNLRELAKAGAEFWQDGFWARFSFIVAPPPPTETEDPGPPVFKRNEAAIEVPARLLLALQEWNLRLGVPEATLEPKRDKKGEPTGLYTVTRPELPHTACTIDDEAAQAWTNYDHALNYLKTKLSHKDFYGSYARLPETAMRIAVLLASLSNNNHINLNIWAKAQELAELLRGYLHDLYSQVNTSEVAPTLTKTIEDKILAYVEQNQNCLDDKDKIPTARNLGRNMHVAAGLIKTVLIDMEQIHMLGKIVRGKTTYYVPFCEDDS